MPKEIASFISLVVPMVAIIGLMYLMVIRPQKKKEKQLQEMLKKLTVGTNIVTVGGIMGKIVNIKDDEITIESGVEKTKVKIQRWAIKDVEKTVEA